jgi:membrane associated rhomboid family serine protease
MRCPECARERTKVRTVRSAPTTPDVTLALIAINVAVFIAETVTGSPLGSGGIGTVWDKGVLNGPAIVNQHEYWRILTSGFMHAGLFHIVVNMLSLWFVGSVLEPAIGRLNFAAVYFASLLGGSFGALLFQPHVDTVGASGAIFGIFGALIVVARARGIPIWQSGLGVVLLINLLFTLSISGISVGGHLGGLIGGFITGAAIVELSEKRGMSIAALSVCVMVGIVSVAGAIAVAGGNGLTPSGIGFTG